MSTFICPESSANQFPWMLLSSDIRDIKREQGFSSLSFPTPHAFKSIEATCVLAYLTWWGNPTLPPSSLTVVCNGKRIILIFCTVVWSSGNYHLRRDSGPKEARRRMRICSLIIISYTQSCKNVPNKQTKIDSNVTTFHSHMFISFN